MTSIITLSFLNTSLSGNTYTFDEKKSCLIGRNDQCDIKIPNIEEFFNISRTHCVLDIDPPRITIEDKNSKYGTYINNQKIGDLKTNLADNDTIRIGDLLIQVSIETPNLSSETQFGETSDSVTSNFDSEDEYYQKSSTIPAHNLRQEQIVYTPPSSLNLAKFVKNWLQRIFQGDDDLDASLLPIQGYYVTKIIGKGTFGEVYLAKHNKTNQEVALKVMLPEMATDDYQREKFMREVENTKALKHPNIIQLLDYGFSEGIFYFTLEYCKLGNLLQYCQDKTSPFNPQEALSLIMPMFDALDYAHNLEIPYVKQKDGGFAKGKGLIHRDINPNNILLTKKNDKIIPKIADFGLAKAFDNAGLSGMSRSGQHLEGTFQFMSREQAINFKYPTPAIDIWALMACLYYLLTLKYPRDFSSGNILLTVLQKKPIPIQKRNPKVPQPLAQIIDKALDDSKELYFQNVTEIKQELSRVC